MIRPIRRSVSLARRTLKRRDTGSPSDERAEPTPYKALEQMERECISGLVEVLRQEGLEAVRRTLWDMTGWDEDYDPRLRGNRATEEQKQVGWEMAVRIEKILCTVLHEAHERQVEKTITTLSEGPEGFDGG